jgi:dipeptidyl aminopeptidase/acylaminoacyl peptidase
MLAHYPKLFKAGIDFYGPSDLKTFLARTASYRRPIRMAEYGDPAKDPKFFEAISPARHARQIKSPLLVIQGANDPIVPPAESADIVRLVRSAGGKAEYLLLPNEGHGFAKEESRIRAFERIIVFLRRYCH